MKNCFCKIIKKISSEGAKQKLLNVFSKTFYDNASFFCFDQDTKGTLETQKQASFIILDKPLFDALIGDFNNSIDSVYIQGEKQY